MSQSSPESLIPCRCGFLVAVSIGVLDAGQVVRCGCQPLVGTPDTLAALRAKLAALTIAAIDYREGIKQREEDEAEWCAAGQTVSRDELTRRAAALDVLLFDAPTPHVEPLT